ncbi:MAG: hypothetical protein WDW38_006287 [Sanguina aurantia]
MAQHCTLEAELWKAQKQLLERDEMFRALQDEQYLKWTLCNNSIKAELRKAKGLDAADLQQVTTVKGEAPVRVQPSQLPQQQATCPASPQHPHTSPQINHFSSDHISSSSDRFGSSSDHISDRAGQPGDSGGGIQLQTNLLRWIW